MTTTSFVARSLTTALFAVVFFLSLLVPAGSAWAAGDGSGTMTVSPTTGTTSASANTYVFDFVDTSSGAYPANSIVTITIPAGWTAPQVSNSANAGYVTVAEPGPLPTDSSCNPTNGVLPFTSGPGNDVTVSGQVITINIRCGQNEHFVVTYGAGSSVTKVTNSSSPGPHTFIVRSQSGGAGLSAIAASPVVTLSAALTAQTITFSNPGSKTYGDATFASNATASSGLAVALTSTTPTVCSVAGLNISLVGDGTCTINANQAGNGTYAAAPQVQQSFTVAKKTITPTVVGTGKTYNASNAAPGTTCTVAGIVGTDTVTCVVGSATYDSANAGTRTITANVSLGGTHASKYVLSTTSPTLTGLTITQAPLTVTANPASRSYNTANPSFTATLTGFVGGEVMGTSGVTGAASCTTTAINTTPVGTAPITCTVGTLAATNYSFGTFTPALLTITKANQTITFGALGGKTYGDADFAVAATSDSGLAVSFASQTPTVCMVTGSTVHIVANGSCTIRASQAGDTNYNAASNVDQTFTIAKKVVTASITAANKVYDGTNLATITGCIVNTPEFAEVVTCAASVVPTDTTFSDKHAGTTKTVTANNITLVGAAAINYTLSPTTATTTANISKAPITVTALFNTKEYDGTVTATAKPTVAPSLFAGDTFVTSEAYQDAAAGTANKTVIPSIVITDGNSGGNYSVVLVNNTVSTITQKALTASGTVPNKPYDGTTVGTVPATIALAGIVGGDDVTATATNADFPSANKGLYTNTVVVSGVTLAGTTAPNYSVAPSFTTTSEITGIPVTASVTAGNKVYDGTDAATVLTCTLTGLAPADVGVVTCAATGATFANKNAGTSKAVTATGITLSGVPATNYTLTSTTAATTADITKRPLTSPAHYGLQTTDKPYDGTTAAPGTNIIFFAAQPGGVVTGDVVTATITSSTFDTADKGVGKTVTASGLSLPVATGANDNYTLGTDPISSTANITARAITITADNASKTIGGADPAFTYVASPAPVAPGDISGALARVAGETAGTYAIQQGTLAVTSNYALTFVDGVFTINKIAQTISFTNPGDKAKTAPNFTVTPTATSALPVVVTSTTPAVCTVAANVVDVLDVGTCTLEANQAGDATYAAAPAVTRSFNVVLDTVAPTLAAMTDITAEATSPAGAVVPFSVPNASDDVDPVVIATCTPASGSTFALGTNPVVCDAVDAAGNHANSTLATTFNVIVKDTTKPTFSTTTADITTPATGPAGATVTFTAPTAVDTVDPAPVVVCVLPSGSTFAIGTNTVTCTATDASGNSRTSSFTVTVTNLDAPVITGTPVSFTVPATSPAGAVVTYTPPTAVDAVDGPTSVSCVPASGSTFPLGNTTVICSSTDLADNTNTSSFIVTVTDQTVPTITLTGPFSITLLVNDTYTEQGATWDDPIVDGTGSVTNITGTVDTAVSGSYTRTYAFSDAAGNVAPAVTRTVTVNKRPHTITFSALANKTLADTDFTVTATSDASLPVILATSSPAVCTVTGSTVHLVGVGVCSITASAAGNGVYLAATDVTQTFTVTKAPHTVTIAPIAAKTTLDTDFNASVISSASLPVTVTSLSPLVCTVAGTLVHIVGPGTCELNASALGNAVYEDSGIAGTTFTVTVGVPPVTNSGNGPIVNTPGFGPQALGIAQGGNGNATNGTQTFVFNPSTNTTGGLALGPTVENSGQNGGGIVAGVSTFRFNTNFRPGSRLVPDVRELQKILIAKGLLKIALPTGVYGPATVAAVKKYQAANGIPVTGNVFHLTRAALNSGK